MKKTLLTIMVLVAMAPPLAAGVNVAIGSNLPAEVHVDGKLVGHSPMTLTDLSPGSHRIDVVRGDDRKTFGVFAPRAVEFEKALNATFEEKPQVAGYQAVTAPISAQAVASEKKSDSHRRKKKRRNIIRWILLGGAAINEAAGTGKSRVGWRTGLLSAIGLNELILW